MNVLIVLLFCIFKLEMASILLDNCRSRFDCATPDHCCVRDYDSKFQHCMPLTEEGDFCTTDLLSNNNAIVDFKCPCKPGLFCNQTKQICQVNEIEYTMRKNCSTGNDCPDDFCCAKDFYGSQRKCLPLLKSGNKCYTDLKNHARTDIFFGFCPCDADSICEKGRCLLKSQYEKDEAEKKKRIICHDHDGCPKGQCCTRVKSGQPAECRPIAKPGEPCDDIKQALSKKILFRTCYCIKKYRCIASVRGRGHCSRIPESKIPEAYGNHDYL